MSMTDQLALIIFTMTRISDKYAQYQVIMCSCSNLIIRYGHFSEEKMLYSPRWQLRAFL